MSGSAPGRVPEHAALDPGGTRAAILQATPSIVLQTREVATIDYSEVRAAIAGGRATLVVSPLDDGQVVGWPLSDLEVATLEPMQRAFRVDMAAWSTDVGLHNASFDLAVIRRQLERPRTPAP